MKVPICSDECVPKYQAKMKDGPDGYLLPNGELISAELWEKMGLAFIAYHRDTGKCVGCGKRTRKHREVTL